MDTNLPSPAADVGSNSVPPNSGRPRLIALIIFMAIFLLIAGFSLGYYYFSKLNKPAEKNNNANITTSIEPTMTPSVAQVKDLTGLFSGKVKKLDVDLKIIVQSEDEKANNMNPGVTYYEAGTYLKGAYKGYTRYVAIKGADGPGGPTVYIFASKDGHTYVLDGKPVDMNSLNDSQNNWSSPIFGMDQKKISKIDYLDTNFVPELDLNTIFGLNRNKVFEETIDTGTKDAQGNLIFEDKLVTDFSKYQPLSSPFPNLTLYQFKNAPDSKEASDMATYIDGTTDVIVVDPTGLAYQYDLSTKSNIEAYLKKYDVFLSELEKYEKITGPNNPYPDVPIRPSLRLTQSDIKTTETIYKNYDVALPTACSNDVNTLIAKNIYDTDLKKIGTSFEGDIYALVDKNHPLIKMAFADKTTLDDQTFSDFNNGLKKPTFDEYFAKNPLLFLKDSWGRYDILGEYDYQIGGGCGKPVIYLYPTKPTAVSVSFKTPITFDVNIPTYKQGWNVLAEPNGTLTDLQPQYTDCNLIDQHKFGSEYAYTACINNNYPYLYWSGQSIGQSYPQIDKGWLVGQKDLANFLNQKLDDIKFNSKEKKDFLEYWLPTLKNKNATFYRISFLQNNEMDQIAPMNVVPPPKNYYRYFLDYQTYDAKPNLAIAPQSLNQITRNGFTYVEWGGLK